jgi:hypothetical protein
VSEPERLTTIHWISGDAERIRVTLAGESSGDPGSCRRFRRLIRRRSRPARRVELAESILYVCALIADQPRAIDRYIDYFGESPSGAGVAAGREM